MIGVVADDITGANDIGIMFGKRGYRAVVLSMDALDADYEADILVVDTDSRLDDRATAYDKTRQAAQRLLAAGCVKLFAKTCSVFRGNIGSYFDAVLDETGEVFAPVILGYPKNGRTTVETIHFVHGEKLENSAFANDAVHPMRESDLRLILQRQTLRQVGAIDWRIVERGAEAVREALTKLRATADYAILDVRNQEDLEVVAEAVRDEKILCGSSAIAEVLPLPSRTQENVLTADISSSAGSPGVLIFAGSLTPQTLAQIEYARTQGVLCYEMDSVSVFGDSRQRLEQRQSLVEAVTPAVAADRNVLLHASNSSEDVRRTLDAGKTNGLSELEIHRAISRELAQVARQIVDRTNCRRVVVGGGDTSGAVCRALEIRAALVLAEIAPGLPVSRTLDPPGMSIVLKSGSFGGVDFFSKAIEMIRRDA